jgi:RND family efflux transporter MFP subunit
MQQLNWLRNWSKKKVYYAITVAVVIICIIGGVLWQKHNTPKPVAEDLPLVRTVEVNPAGAVQTYTYSGEVRDRFESQLAFQASGKIVKRNVQLGSTVNAGDVLMQIDPKDLQQTVNNTSAQVNSAESQLRLAESNLNRYSQLYAQNAISASQLDQYQNAYNVAAAAVRQASSQYIQGANQLDYSLLYADKPGVISSISAEAGQVVSTGQTVITLVQDGEREIEISVPENRIATLSQVSQIKVTFWALPTVVVDGTVREIAPMADATTRTYKIRIHLVNAPPEIKLGMTAAVTLTGSGDPKAGLTTIPLSSIYQTNDSPGVWVVTDAIVNLRPVQVGSFGDVQVQVLAGLNPGETIVTAGAHKLREGQKVRVVGGDSQ